MDREEDSILAQSRLLLRRIAPLGIVALIAVFVGILLVLIVSWLGEVYLQVPLQDSVLAFMGNGVLLSIAFALLAPFLSERALSHQMAQTGRQLSPQIEPGPQLDIKAKEETEKAQKLRTMEQFWNSLEPLRKSVEEIGLPTAKPRKKLEAETTPSKIETTPTIKRPIVEEIGKPAGSKNAVPETSTEQGPALIPPERLKPRAEEMSFNCSMCGKPVNLAREKVEQIQKGEVITAECPHCHNQYPFDYDRAKVKLPSGRIHTLQTTTEENTEIKAVSKSAVKGTGPESPLQETQHKESSPKQPSPKSEPSRLATPIPAPPQTAALKLPQRREPSERSIIKTGDHLVLDLDLDEGREAVVEVSATGPVNVYIMTEENVRALDLDQEFWYEAGREAVQKTTVSFTAPEIGKWFLVVENDSIKDVIVTVETTVSKSSQPTSLLKTEILDLPERSSSKL